MRYRISKFRHRGSIAVAGFLPLGWASWELGGIAVVFAMAAVTTTVAILLCRRRKERRSAVERRRLLDGVESVVAELRAGAAPGRAAQLASRDCTGDAAAALACCAAHNRLGGSAADGLVLLECSISTELQLLAGAWRVAEEHGLALADLLAAARSDLLGRIAFHDSAQAALAGTRMSAAILAGLPLLGIGLGELMGAAPLALLLQRGPGGLLLVFGVGLVCAGLYWSDTIARRVVSQ